MNKNIDKLDKSIDIYGVLTKYPLSSTQIKDILMWLNDLSNNKKGTYISLVELKFISRLDLSNLYSLLEDLCKIGVFKCHYKCYCKWCNKPLGDYEYFNEVPDSIVCRRCGNINNGLVNMYFKYSYLKY